MKVWRKQRGLQVPRVPLNSTRTRTYSTSSHQSPPYTMMVAIGKASIKQIYVYIYIIFHIYTHRYTCIDDLPTITGSRQAPMCKRIYTYSIYNIRITSQLGFSTAMDCSIILLAVGIAAAAMAAMDQKSIRAPDVTDDPRCSQCVPIVKCSNYVLSTLTRCSD